MIIADTNIVSEFMKETPNTRVMSWARALGAAELTISVVTVEEIERGLGQIPQGRRRQDLERRWSTLLAGFADTIAVYDMEAARATAQILVDGLDHGRTMALADAQIAGICLALGASLATRNTKDFRHVAGLTTHNPFDTVAGPSGADEV